MEKRGRRYTEEQIIAILREAGRTRGEGWRGAPAPRSGGQDLLPLEAEVRRPRGERRAPAEATGGREPAAEAAGGPTGAGEATGRRSHSWVVSYDLWGGARSVDDWARCGRWSGPKPRKLEPFNFQLRMAHLRCRALDIFLLTFAVPQRTLTPLLPPGSAPPVRGGTNGSITAHGRISRGLRGPLVGSHKNRLWILRQSFPPFCLFGLAPVSWKLDDYRG